MIALSFHKFTKENQFRVRPKPGNIYLSFSLVQYLTNEMSEPPPAAVAATLGSLDDSAAAEPHSDEIQ
jgi:hypothetical protein